MVDAWIDGQTYVPKLMPDNVVVPVLSAHGLEAGPRLSLDNLGNYSHTGDC